jgi:hypothetical protein
LLWWATALDEHVFWADWADTGQLWAWNRQQGSVLVAESAEWLPAAVGLSQERFVWVGGTGPRASSGSYESAQFFSCLRSAQLERCDVQSGPVIPMRASGLEMAASGQWAAVVGGSETERWAYVADLERNVAYGVTMLPGRGSLALAGLSSRYLFIQDMPVDVMYGDHIEGWLRYDLSKLSEFATKF